MSKEVEAVVAEESAEIIAARTALTDAKEKLARFLKKNGLESAEDVHGEPEIEKKKENLVRKVEEQKKLLKKAKKGTKAPKEKSVRESKYDYPEDCVTKEDKKKFRSKMRAEAAAALKPKKEKVAAKDVKAEAPVEKKNKKARKTDDD